MFTRRVLMNDFQMQATILHQNALQTILVGQGTIMTMLGTFLLYELPSTFR
jgi:hypothetical protein